MNIDADAIDLTIDAITDIARGIRKKGVPMLLGKHLEKVHDRPYMMDAGKSSTGFRAMTSRALEPLLKMDRKWVDVFPGRFGMDHALNILVYGQGKPVPRSEIELSHLETGRHTPEQLQSQQRGDVSRRLRGEKPLDNSVQSLAFREKIARRRLK